MKKFFFLAAALSLFAFTSCQDNATPEGGAISLADLADNSYLVGTLTGEITSAYTDNYGGYYSEDNTNIELYLNCDEVETDSEYSSSGYFYFDLDFPGADLTELQPGTYEGGSPQIQYCDYTYYDDEGSETYIQFESVTVQISKTGDDFSITVSGTFAATGSTVLAKYTGPVLEYD